MSDLQGVTETAWLQQLARAAPCRIILIVYGLKTRYTVKP